MDACNIFFFQENTCVNKLSIFNKKKTLYRMCIKILNLIEILRKNKNIKS